MASPKNPSSKASTPKVNFLFHRENYVILFIGLVALIIGYMLMSGGSQSSNEWNTDEIYSFRRTTLAPIVVGIGYLIVLYSILHKPRK